MAPFGDGIYVDQRMLMVAAPAHGPLIPGRNLESHLILHMAVIPLDRHPGGANVSLPTLLKITSTLRSTRPPYPGGEKNAQGKPVAGQSTWPERTSRAPGMD